MMSGRRGDAGTDAGTATGVISAGTAAGLMLAGTAAIFCRSAWECGALTVPRYSIRSPKIRQKRTLLFLSDLHDREFGPGNRDLIQAAETEEPDLVLIGGDMMTVKRKADIGRTITLSEALAERCPVCYADGNHETRLNRDRGRYGDLYDELDRALGRLNIFHLTDRSADFFSDIRISGVTIPQDYYGKFRPKEMEIAFLQRRLSSASRDRFQILLAHTPLFQRTYCGWGADLTLSGHFHGGTIRLPGGIGLMTPQFQFFRREVEGLHRMWRFRNGLWEESSMIVSAGLGTHSINLRLNNRPQLVVVHLLPEVS